MNVTALAQTDGDGGRVKNRILSPEIMASMNRAILLALAMTLEVGAVAAEQISGLDRLAPWRPQGLSADLLKPDAVKAREALSKLSYTEKDADRLLLAGLALPGAESAPALIGYAETCRKKSGKADILWARAVYAVGVTRTEAAARFLMDQWDEVDQRLKTGAVEVKLVPEEGFDPLCPLTDAVHFCFGVPGVREWAMKRINEELPTPKGIELPLRQRRLARRIMLRHLIRWDIAEAADSASAIRPEQLLEGQMASPIRPRDLEASCKAVLEWVGRLPVLPLDANEKQWQQAMWVDAVWAFDSESMHLGLPLALKLYELYLKPVSDGDKAKKEQEARQADLRPDVKARLWMIARLAIQSDSTVERALRPNEAIRGFLKDAAEYYLELPGGQVRRDGAEGLFTLQCETVPEPLQPWWQAVDRLVKVALTPAEKEAVLTRTEYFRRRTSATKD